VLVAGGDDEDDEDDASVDRTGDGLGQDGVGAALSDPSCLGRPHFEW
jgi:hypothetical protein